MHRRSICELRVTSRSVRATNRTTTAWRLRPPSVSRSGTSLGPVSPLQRICCCAVFAPTTPLGTPRHRAGQLGARQSVDRPPPLSGSVNIQPPIRADSTRRAQSSTLAVFIFRQSNTSLGVHRAARIDDLKCPTTTVSDDRRKHLSSPSPFLDQCNTRRSMARITDSALFLRNPHRTTNSTPSVRKLSRRPPRLSCLLAPAKRMGVVRMSLAHTDAPASFVRHPLRWHSHAFALPPNEAAKCEE